MKMRILHENKSLDVDARSVSAIGRYIGLMFKSKETENLLFEIKNERFAIHSCFVFFPFLAVWLNTDDRVIKSEVIRPWRFHIPAEENAKKLVEIPLNNENKQIVEFLVGKERFK